MATTYWDCPICGVKLEISHGEDKESHHLAAHGIESKIHDHLANHLKRLFIVLKMQGVDFGYDLTPEIKEEG